MYTVENKEKCPYCVNGVVTTTTTSTLYPEPVVYSYPCSNQDCLNGFIYTEVSLEDAIVDLLRNNSKIRCMKW